MYKNWLLFLPVVLNSASKFVVPAILLPIVAKRVGFEEFGKLSAYYSVAIILSVIVDFSTSVYGPVIYAKRSLTRRLFLLKNIFLIRMLIYLLMISILFLLQRMQMLEPMLILIFLVCGAAVLLDFSWLLITENLVWKLLISSLLGIGFCLAITGYFFATKNSQGAIIAALTMPFFLSALFTFMMSHKLIKQAILNSLDVKEFFSDMIFASKSLASQLVSSMYSNAGPIICAYYGNYALAGTWTIINRLVGGFGNLAITPLRVNVTKITQSWTDEEVVLTSEVKRNIAYCLAMFSVLVLAFLLIPKDYLKLLTDVSVDFHSFTYLMICVWLFCAIPAYLMTQLFYYDENTLGIFIINTGTFIILVASTGFVTDLYLVPLLLMYTISQLPAHIALIIRIRNRR